MKVVYIFSGLGADERVFREIDLSGHPIVFIRWIAPLRGEGMVDYCRRLSQQITVERPVLIGLSFGGMVAVEVGKLIETERIVVIASAKTRSEIPFYYRWVGVLRLDTLVPTRLLLRPGVLGAWAFGVSTEEERLLFAEILRDTDPEFLKWAIHAIVGWKNTVRHGNLVHIHGTADRILPFALVKADVAIEGGGHFMTVNRAVEVTAAIRAVLEDVHGDRGREHGNEGK